MERLQLPDGRTLEYLVAGPAGGMPLVLHHGTPGAAVRYAPIFDPAEAQGFRVLMHSRPGYADSSPQPGRPVAAVAADVAALLDEIGASTFVTAGMSGGGPHALACAALLPDRCRAAASIAGVAPYGAPDLDWLAGMGEENIAEFGAALAGEPELAAFLTGASADLVEIRPAVIVAAFGDLISEVDRRALVGGFADYQAESLRRSVTTGTAGWRDDDLAFVRDWGFSVQDIRPPVSVWQGDQDRMVPQAHGRWLATHLPAPEPHLLPGEGHLSLIDNFAVVVASLNKAATA